MPALDQLQLLRSGAHNWNKWRESHPQITPSLDGADLREVDLSGANLDSAACSDADFSRANLTGASLRHADLTRAHLVAADLTAADLENAGARFANFRDATLQRANLCLANFQGADLRGASLQFARLGYTVLADVDLTGAHQLASCRFLMPVSLDFRTLLRSPQLPVPFLRGCGVPEELLENLPVLFRKPIQHYSLFLESAPEDAPLVERISADLQARGVRCWAIDPSTAPDAIRPADSALAVVVSRHSVSSAWLERDTHLWMRTERLHSRRLLFALRTDDVVLRWSDHNAEQLLNRRAVDFRRWTEPRPYGNALTNLLAALPT